jgi:hypothetical protein
MRARIALVALFAVLLPACGVGVDEGGAARADGEQRYRVTAVVLDDRDGGPELCLGAVADSYPPQCGGPPIRGWRWADVPDEGRAGGTVWGEYELVGTYERGVFTVLRAGRSRRAQPVVGPDPSAPPCAAPGGGWRAADPAAASDARLRMAIRRAQAQPDSAGAWVFYLVPPSDPPDPRTTGIVAAFTGDLARHRRELERVWGGALCVVGRERRLRALRWIASDVHRRAAVLRLELLGSTVDVFANRVTIDVVTIDAEGRRALADRYGAGAVHAIPALRPIS